MRVDESLYLPRTDDYLLWEYDQVQAIGGAELAEWRAELLPEEYHTLLALLWGRVIDAIPWLRAYLDQLQWLIEWFLGLPHATLRSERHA